MKQWMKWSLALLAGALVLSATGCATLGLANPFSSGADAFQDAKSALNDGEYAAAFKNAGRAISRDEKHYPSYKLIVKNYDEGMAKVQAELDELANTDDTIQTQIREVELYDQLNDFMIYIESLGDPAVVTFRKDSVTIPIVDYSEQLADARQRGFDLAMQQAEQLLDFEDFEKAGETFDVVVEHFASYEGRDDVKAQIADMIAARGEQYVAELTYDMIEDVNALIGMAETYSETERVQELRTNLNAEALDITLGEAKRIAEGATIEAYREAIIVAHDAYEFVEDNAEIDELRRGWAEKAMVLSREQVNRVEPQYDGTIAGLEPVRAAYKDMLRWIDGWESITGYEDIPEQYAQFIEDSKIRVYAVKSGDFKDAVVSNVLTATRDEVRSRSDKRYWFHTDKELETAEQESHSQRGPDLQKDNDSDFSSALEDLNGDSSCQEASSLGIQYLIRVSADAGSATTTENTRTERKTRSGHQTVDGEVDVSPAAFYIPFRRMYENDPDQFRSAMAEEGFTNMWFDVPVEFTYTSVTKTQPVTFTVVVERCSDGRQIYSDRFNFTYSATGDEVLTGASADVGAMESYYEDDVRDPAEPGNATYDAIREAFNAQYNASAVATAITRN